VAGSSSEWTEPYVYQPEMERRRATKRRRKAQATRPNRPVTPDQLREIRKREAEAKQDAMLNSEVARRSRERMRKGG